MLKRLGARLHDMCSLLIDCIWIAQTWEYCSSPQDEAAILNSVTSLDRGVVPTLSLMTLSDGMSCTSLRLGSTPRSLHSWRQSEMGQYDNELRETFGFEVKDSGERQKFASGMQRDVTTDKTDYSLALDGPMFERYAVHLTKGAQKYDARNWMKANGIEEAARFHQSAVRHFFQWLKGDEDEDHAAAVFFNINGYEYVREKIRNTPNSVR